MAGTSLLIPQCSLEESFSACLARELSWLSDGCTQLEEQFILPNKLCINECSIASELTYDDFDFEFIITFSDGYGCGVDPQALYEDIMAQITDSPTLQPTGYPSPKPTPLPSPQPTGFPSPEPTPSPTSAFTSSGTINGKLYMYNPTELTFDAAREVCYSAGMDLASFATEEEFLFLDTVSEGEYNDPFWIGLRGDQGNYGGDPTAFSFVDGSTEGLEFFSDKSSGEYPWYGNAPTNTFGGEDCIGYFTGVQGLDDTDCDYTELPSMCMTKAESTQVEFTGTGSINGKFYAYSPTALNFYDAREACFELGMDLASFGSEEELDFLATVVAPFQSYVYIGATGIQPPGGDPSVFTFVDGSTQGLDLLANKVQGEYPWITGEPNNVGTGEDCVAYRTHVRMLQDVNCNNWEIPFMCKKQDITFTASGMINGKLYMYSPTLLSFDDAREACLDRGMDLASFDSEEEVAFLGTVPEAPDHNYFYIGANGSQPAGGDAYKFSFIDGSTEGLELLSEKSRGSYPWFSGEPNNLGGEEACAAYIMQNQLLMDIDCTKLQPFMCMAPAESNEQGFTSSGVINEKMYMFNPNSLGFDEAREVCLDNDMDLASFATEEEFRFLDSVADESSNFFLVGVRATEFPLGDPSVFSFVDGSTEGLDFLTNKAVGEFPWGTGQPNDSGGGQECVGYYTGLQTLDDGQCHYELPFMCMRHLF